MAERGPRETKLTMSWSESACVPSADTDRSPTTCIEKSIDTKGEPVLHTRIMKDQTPFVSRSLYTGLGFNGRLHHGVG